MNLRKTVTGALLGLGSAAAMLGLGGTAMAADTIDITTTANPDIDAHAPDAVKVGEIVDLDINEISDINLNVLDDDNVDADVFAHDLQALVNNGDLPADALVHLLIEGND
ncbi:hypothetical protein KCV87_20225 [Actinosynnema pretiosum subsp. pretiosum]|uniref:Uncharacterized protein n=3 Tax=Actinosynnema TaxID=40566 RepID=C6WCK3_ACTMD|nr:MULTISPECIES: hypothetical protein [Actinosynnema]ACU34024.1 hypothetical protein Amir_0050 [Actinosynnema mirum DSM 43827]ATE51911.1 hypothetical protein CNX65_00265 [Actinosynnema pretiosum]AXX27417.1 hypothetical protein APASM_0052 [Actinosynnema pretiosum subsp. pretiosum]QUF01862.1 hypothetical protein KCV87_20225 [Actinosynnema pretiosum subsp. pretiosum]